MLRLIVDLRHLCVRLLNILRLQGVHVANRSLVLLELFLETCSKLFHALYHLYHIIFDPCSLSGIFPLHLIVVDDPALLFLLFPFFFELCLYKEIC